MSVEERDARGPANEGAARFELAPPRRFMLPAILLLLSERPSYGYALVPQLRDLRFGRVDRPAVYRALGQLERDGLVHVSAEHTRSGQTRRVYSVTPLGERVLRVWMGVIREEHAHLGEVIHRYQATGTTDAVLAEVESGWVPELDVEWSSVSTTSRWRRRLLPLEEAVEAAGPGAPDPATAGPPPPSATDPATPAARRTGAAAAAPARAASFLARPRALRCHHRGTLDGRSHQLRHHRCRGLALRRPRRRRSEHRGAAHRLAHH